MNLNTDVNMLRDTLTGDAEHQWREIAKYLYRLVEELKYVLDNLDEENLTVEMAEEWKRRGETLGGMGRMKNLVGEGKAAYDITVPGNSGHLLVINTDITGASAVIQTSAYTNGTVSLYQINAGPSITLAVGSNKITATLDTARKIYIQDICVFGENVTVG